MTDVIESTVVTPPASKDASTVPATETPVVNVETPSSDETPVVNAEATTTPETASTPESEGEVPRKNRAQDRIEDLVAEKNAAKEYAEYWREKALEIIQQEKPQSTAARQVEEQVADEPPTLEQLGYDQAAWSKAVAKWTQDQVAVQVNRALTNKEIQTAQAAVTDQFQSRVDSFKESHPDFDTVMSNPRLPQLDRISAAMIVGSEHGADLSYNLAKNPDVAVKISRMSASQQALAIGRLEAEIIRSKEAPAPAPVVPKAKPAVVAVTAAPEPPTPVPAGGTPATDPGDMDIKEWMRARVQDARRDRRNRTR
jgi:hypothetical protein